MPQQQRHDRCRAHLGHTLLEEPGGSTCTQAQPAHRGQNAARVVIAQLLRHPHRALCTCKQALWHADQTRLACCACALS